MGKRRRSREFAVQVLYHLEFSQDDSPEDVFEIITGNFEVEESTRDFSRELVLGVCREKRLLDDLISGASKHWRIHRIARLERCILRLGAYEMLFMKDIPPKVSIDEAVEIGKKFGSTDSGGFINGILDNIYNSLVNEGRINAGADGASPPGVSSPVRE